MFYSYDIFDTILYRKVPKPADIFSIMERKIQSIWPASLGTFSTCRKKSEFWLRHRKKKEISIEDIYMEIRKNTGISQELAEKLINIEYNIEKSYSFLNKKIVDEIKKHIKVGNTVVLISDMYWHEKQIRDWLTNLDNIFADIKVYISCDYGVTKSTGKLFAFVKDKERVDYTNWIHTGDNKRSDGIVPRKLGIQDVVIQGAIKYDFENKIGNQDMNMLATYGIISEARISSNCSAYDMGVSIAAPIVYQYVEWVIQQALEKQIKKLYFVLRDGYILKIVADRIIAQRNLPVETQFLFGSRVAWRFPELTISKLHELTVWEKSNWIFRDPAIAYVPFERMGFSREKLDEIFGEDFGKQELHTFREFKELLEIALKNDNFSKQLASNIKKAGDYLDEYLMQSLDFTVPFALVDTNSTGKTQYDLNQFLKKRHGNISELVFFYHTYLSSNTPDLNTQFVFFDADKLDRRLPEAFFRAPYNPCYGYKKTKQGIEPKFYESKHCAWNESFDYESYLNGILSFTEKMENHLKDRIDICSYVHFLLKVVNFDIISKDVIKQIAKMPFNPDINGDEILDFYPKLKVSSIFHPFSQLIYYPKGSYYNAGGVWIIIYKMLYRATMLKRKQRK